jgi:histidinol-phosphate/aromatic aminotransferase/cobyric acid decarboxylase-like protein
LAGRRLARHCGAVRVFGGVDDPDDRHFRVAVRAPEENERLLTALAAEWT